MKRNNSRPWLAAVAIAFAALTSQIVGQSAASAATVPAASGQVSTTSVGDRICRSEVNRYTICFQISRIGGSSQFTIHVGLDVVMTQRDAQSIIDSPGQEFSATLFGEDTFFDDTLKSLPVSASWAWAGGLSAEFNGSAFGTLLDEDWDGTDEVFARVKLYVPITGATRTFRTATFSNSFELYPYS